MELGITKDVMKRYKIVEFDIKDMYELPDGKMCYSCKKGVKCEKHPLVKKHELVRE